MAKKKFYAVKVGKVPGIYSTWSECEEQVKGCPSASYKSFATLSEAENFMLENEKTVYEQQLYMISRNTEEQKKMMEGFREERHNFINKLIVLKDDMEHSEKERALEELNWLMQELPGKSIISNCGNSTVDALINFKNITAEKAGVAFRLKIFIPANLPINQCDLGVVMGNADGSI